MVPTSSNCGCRRTRWTMLLQHPLTKDISSTALELFQEAQIQWEGGVTKGSDKKV